MIATNYQFSSRTCKSFSNSLINKNVDMGEKLKTPGERLAAARLAKDLSQSELARRAKRLGGRISQAMISGLEANTYTGTAAWSELAAILGVNSLWLASGRGAREATNVSVGPEIRGKVPLISWVAASAFNDIVDNFHPGEADEWVEVTVPIHQHTYALRVSGPSMTNPTGQEPTFPDGCKIVIEPNLIDHPQNMVGLFVIVRRHNEDTATFKQLIRDGDRFLLHPLNPQFPNIELQDGDVFCGVVREKPVRYV